MTEPEATPGTTTPEVDPYPRDYIGYGRNPPQGEWPGGARLAINFGINVEAGSERSFANGDGRNETVGELNRPSSSTSRDLGVESTYEYDSRVGTFRLLRLFRRYEIKTTVFAAAMAVERTPEIGDWIREDGHEPCGHGWRWEEEWGFDRSAMEERVVRTVELLQRTCGTRPVGWLSRWLPNPALRELLVKHGFQYDSHPLNDEVPYYVWPGGSPLLILPYSLVYNDAKFFFGGYSSPTDFADYCRRAINFMVREGDGVPRMLSIGVHGRWTGQAGRADALREVIEHALATEGVWICRRSDVAAWWLENRSPTPADKQTYVKNITHTTTFGD